VIERMSVKDHRLVLPNGMSYRVLVLPARGSHDVPLIKSEGSDRVGGDDTHDEATPDATPTYQNFPDCDKEIDATSLAVWGIAMEERDASCQRQGRARLGRISGCPAGAKGVTKDFSTTAPLNWIHRRTDDATSTLCHPASDEVEAKCSFRVLGKQPELWDPNRATLRDLLDYTAEAQVTTVPLRFGPTQSFFIVFRKLLTRDREKNSRLGKRFRRSAVCGSIRFPITLAAAVSDQVRQARVVDRATGRRDSILLRTASYSRHIRFDPKTPPSGSGAIAIISGDVQVMAESA